MKELFWSDVGTGLAIVGTTPATASVRANGTDEQVGQWIADPAARHCPHDLRCVRPVMRWRPTPAYGATWSAAGAISPRENFSLTDAPP
jgi:hypothetical protein